MESKLCKLLNIEWPIFQGGMAWISDACLASAVSEAGGLGIIAAGNGPGEWLRAEIQKAKTLTNKPFGVNLMLLSPYIEEVVEVILQEKVEILITGAGDPSPYMDRWLAHGIKVIPVVPSVALAKRMERIGATAVIAEGGEAGGHIGELNTMALVPQVVDAVTIPVIAAGGIADGRGIAAAKCLGASGVQLGTRFLVAEECRVHPNYKAVILEARDIDTLVTGRPTGHPVRVIKNKLARQFKKLDKTPGDLSAYEVLGRGALHKAAVEGDVDYGSVMAGQSAGLVKKTQTCQGIIEELFQEYEAILGQYLKAF